MKQIYQDIINKLKVGHACILETELEQVSSGEYKEIKKCIWDAKNEGMPIFEEGMNDGIPGDIVIEKKSSKVKIWEPFWPEERLIILGGGHISLYLSDFATKIGFSVTVVDDRPFFANKARFPEAKEVICDSFQEAIEQLSITPYDYVVMVTRGHRHDMDCYKKILTGNQPYYTGMIGSKRRIKGLKELFLEEGYEKAKLDLLYAPIGLEIGAQTPEEIAISIVAQLIQQKRLNPQKKAGTVVSKNSTDYRVLDTITGNINESCAIVTVLETKGSVPRKAGAKMIVRQSGQVIGTIGGGCSEMEVIHEAIPMIGTKAVKMKLVDMTGDVAEEEGMVCGGIMTVLIETY